MPTVDIDGKEIPYVATSNNEEFKKLMKELRKVATAEGQATIDKLLEEAGE